MLLYLYSIAAVALGWLHSSNANASHSASIDVDDDLSASVSWIQWKAKYNVTYATLDEDQFRFETFRNNVKFIHLHNKLQNSKYTLAVNQFASLTEAEFSAKRCAYPSPRRSGPTTNQSIVADNNYNNNNNNNNNSMRRIAIATSVDWRETPNIVTPVKNQGICGSCWAFSATGSIESRYAIKHGILNSLSEQELLDCAGDYGNCRGGFTDVGFIYARMNNGLSLESEYIYVEHDARCEKAHYQHYNAVESFVEIEQSNVTALMMAVNEGPVTVGIEASTAFDYYNGGIFDGLCGCDINHMVLIVGYGQTPNGDKYWIVKNSYGSFWGESGYIRICRDCHKNDQCGQCCILCNASFVIVK